MITTEQLQDWLKKRNEKETLERIGEDFGVTGASISRWITGERNPSRMALKIASKIYRKRQAVVNS